MSKQPLLNERKTIILAILFVFLFISLLIVDTIADNRLDYVSGTNIEKNKKMETTLNIKRGEYRLIIDNSALFGPGGQIFRPIPGDTKVKLTLHNSSDIVAGSGETILKTTSRIMINKSINTIGRVEIGFFIPTDLSNAILEFESDRKVSGAIFEKNKMHSVDDAQIISLFRLIPYLGIVVIFAYGIHKLTMRIINSSFPYRKTGDKKKIL